MNETTYKEFEFFLNTMAKEIGGNEKNKILSISSQMINSKNYMNLVKEKLDNIIGADDFNIFTDFAVLLKCVIDMNQYVDFYKEITPDRLKFLLYPVLYANLYKNHIDVLNGMSIGDFRLLYANAIDLVFIPIQTVQIVKESCTNCLARKVKLLSWLENKIKIERE